MCGSVVKISSLQHLTPYSETFGYLVSNNAVIVLQHSSNPGIAV
jgi:hypothetical protein